jgi:hypothetical protein
MKRSDREVGRETSPGLEPAGGPGEAGAPLVTFRDLFLLAGVFLVSRVILHRVFSVEIDSWMVNQLHHIPPPLLRADLARSVYYLHTQPPLWNLILGAILKLGGQNWAYGYLAMSLGLGLVLQSSLFAVLRQLGVGRVPALLVACVYMMDPQVIAYENLVGYDSLAASLLTLLTALFLPAARRGAPWGLAAFAAVASVMVVVRSNFHPLILLPWFGLVALANPSRYRGVVVAAVLAALPCAAVLAKNQVVFGKASMSSWLGSQVVYMLQVDPDDPWIQGQVRSGAVSPLVLRKPLDTLDHYPDVDPGTPPSDAPVLTQARVEGIDNYHHFGYIAISEHYFRDAKVLIARRPRLWPRPPGRTSSRRRWTGASPITTATASPVTSSSSIGGSSSVRGSGRESATPSSPWAWSPPWCPGPTWPSAADGLRPRSTTGGVSWSGSCSATSSSSPSSPSRSIPGRPTATAPTPTPCPWPSW